jgi:hypothetical protein
MWFIYLNLLLCFFFLFHFFDSFCWLIKCSYFGYQSSVHFMHWMYFLTILFLKELWTLSFRVFPCKKRIFAQSISLLSLFLVTQLQCFFFFLFLLLCWMGVHCGIYKSAYNMLNISYLNTRPPSFSFITLPPFLDWFQQKSFFYLHTCVQSICTIFTLLYHFPTSSPPPTGTKSHPP